MQDNPSSENSSTDISLFVRIIIFISIISICVNIALLYTYLFPKRQTIKIIDKSVNNIDLKEFRTGIFLPVAGDKIPPAYYIIRDSLYQTEIYAPNNHENRFKIAWVSDAEYELQFISSNYSPSDYLLNEKLNVKIFSGNNNYYKCIIQGRHSNNVVTVYKIIVNEQFLRPNQALKLTE